MVSLTVYDQQGGEVGSYEIDPEQIAPKINKQLLHDAVVMYQANLRQGSSLDRILQHDPLQSRSNQHQLLLYLATLLQIHFGWN